jgi:hypothetical protein
VHACSARLAIAPATRLTRRLGQRYDATRQKEKIFVARNARGVLRNIKTEKHVHTCQIPETAGRFREMAKAVATEIQTHPFSFFA